MQSLRASLHNTQHVLAIGQVDEAAAVISSTPPKRNTKWSRTILCEHRRDKSSVLAELPAYMGVLMGSTRYVAYAHAPFSQDMCKLEVPHYRSPMIHVYIDALPKICIVTNSPAVDVMATVCPVV
jgi:hypothetical protein